MTETEPTPLLGRLSYISMNSFGAGLRTLGLCVFGVLCSLQALGAQSPTTTSLIGVPNPARFGETVTLTASVNPLQASGNVTFYSGDFFLGVAKLNGGLATIKTDSLPAGLPGVTARYDGSSSLEASSSPVYSIPVTAYPGGSYTLPAAFSTGAFPTGVAVADLNGDGNADLLVLDANGFEVLHGNGNGTFAAAVPAGLPGVSLSDLFVVADFNSDGNADIVQVSGDSLLVQLGNSDGSFQSPVSYPVLSGPRGIVAADLDGDGLTDLIVANSGYGVVSWLRGNGDGSFQPALPIAAVTDPESLAVADFNGDGQMDIAVGTPSQSGLVVLLAASGATFQPGRFYAAANNVESIAVGDFNGDDQPDLVAANAYGEVSIFLGSPAGIFQPALNVQAELVPNYTTGADLRSVAVGDFNGDGISDIVVTNYGNNAVGVLLGAGGTCWVSASGGALTFPTGGGSASLTVTAGASGCPWGISASDPWIQLSVPGGSGSGSVSVSVQPNTTGADRSGTIFFGGQQIAVAEPTTPLFSDVAPSDYYYQAVNMLAAKGITSGCGSGVFCPLNSVTRAQMAVFIVRSVYGGDNFSYSPVPYFADVPVGAFGFQWIQKLYELGITSGCGGGNYCPSNFIPRNQMAVFIIRGRLGINPNFDFPSNPFFTDVPNSGFGFDWIQRLKWDTITSGCTSTLYCPVNSVTRGDMAIFIMRGLFNQLLASDTPVLASVSSPSIVHGNTVTETIVGSGTHFAAGATSILPIPGVTFNNVTVAGPYAVVADFTVAANARLQPQSIVVKTGSEDAVLPNGLTIQ